jgi:hypothetical protein
MRRPGRLESMVPRKLLSIPRASTRGLCARLTDRNLATRDRMRLLRLCHGVADEPDPDKAAHSPDHPALAERATVLLQQQRKIIGEPARFERQETGALAGHVRDQALVDLRIGSQRKNLVMPEVASALALLG